MPQTRTEFQQLEGHELYRVIEDELDEMFISEDFLTDQPNHATQIRTALDSLQTVLENVSAEAEAWAEEKSAEEDEEED